MRLFRRQTRLIQTITKTKEKVITEQQDMPDELATTGSQETQLTEKKEKITENIKVVEAEYFNNKNRALDPEVRLLFTHSVSSVITAFSNKYFLRLS